MLHPSHWPVGPGAVASQRWGTGGAVEVSVPTPQYLSVPDGRFAASTTGALAWQANGAQRYPGLDARSRCRPGRTQTCRAPTRARPLGSRRCWTDCQRGPRPRLIGGERSQALSVGHRAAGVKVRCRAVQVGVGVAQSTPEADGRREVTARALIVDGTGSTSHRAPLQPVSTGSTAGRDAAVPQGQPRRYYCPSEPLDALEHGRRGCGHPSCSRASPTCEYSRLPDAER